MSMIGPAMSKMVTYDTLQNKVTFRSFRKSTLMRYRTVSAAIA